MMPIKVRELIKILERDGWFIVNQVGSHRQYKHPIKKGEMKAMDYPVVLEKTENNWAAYSPDVLGCMATGKTAEQALDEFKKALILHLQGLIEDNLPLPKPSSRVEYVSVPLK